MDFYKVNSNGNDFIIVINQCFNENDIKKYCTRHFQIGADGFIFIDSFNNVFLYNSDGSSASLCGNGLICISRLLSYLNNNQENIISLNNEKYILKQLNDDYSLVNMPYPIMVPYKNGYMVYIKNTHYIKIVKDIDNINFSDEDYNISTSKKCNLHYVSVLNKNTFKIKTYEYGANKTLSCGSGSMASFFLLNMLSKIDDKANVITEGGLLYCEFNNGAYYLKGKANIIYKGEYYGF